MSEGTELGKRNWRSNLYFFYNRRVFPILESLRGATRLNEVLEDFAKRDLDKASGTDYIGEFSWQNLVILDGCRYDVYDDAVDRNTGSRISAGSMSQDFIQRNFSEGDWSDVIYITANPFFSEENFKDLTGRDVQDVFHSVFHTYKTKWDDENNTVMPEAVFGDAMTAEKLFPDKRKIIHFMQPHHPFVEDNLTEAGFGDILGDEKTTHEWEMAMDGKISHETVEEAYKKNLELVIPHVNELVEELSGKTIITADHGNYLGENGFYGHPKGRDEKALRKVPWDVHT